MKLKIDLIDYNLEIKSSTEIESEKMPFEFEIIRLQCKEPDKEGKLAIRKAETKLFYIKR